MAKEVLHWIGFVECSSVKYTNWLWWRTNPNVMQCYTERKLYNIKFLFQNSSSCHAACTDFHDSHYSSLSSIASSWSPSLHPMSLQIYCWYFFAGRPTLACLCKKVHLRTSLMSSTLFLQQFPTCVVCLIRMVLEIGGRWQYTCSFV